MSTATTQAHSIAGTTSKAEYGIQEHKPLINKIVLKIASMFRTNRLKAWPHSHKSFIEENTLHPTLGPEISRVLR